MKSDFTTIIADQVRQAEPDLDARLEAQAEALNEFECTNLTIGKWIEEFGLEYLLAAFALNDQDFAESFPKLAHISQHDREKMKDTFSHHVDACVRCARRVGFDAEMDSRIERSIESGQRDKDKILETPNEPHHYCSRTVHT